jgi:hypothetical protein
MQAVLNKVWEHLLPAMQPDTLPADEQACGALRDKLASLSLPLPQGKALSPRAEEWSGKTYTLESNELTLESIATRFDPQCSTLTIRDERGEHTLRAGYGTWRTDTTALRGPDEEPVAASGAWTADGTYEVRACYHEGVFCSILRCRYADGELQLDIEPNVAWGPAKATTIKGRMVADA